MRGLRLFGGAAVASLAATLYGYVDLVAPKFSPLAFGSLAGATALAYKRYLAIAALVLLYALAPTLGMDTMFVTAGLALVLGVLVAVGGGDGDVNIADDQEAKVRRILTQHAPHKLPRLPRILKKYDGDWDAMLRAAEDKYVYGRAAPTPFKSPAANPHGREDVEEDEVAPLYSEPMRQPDFDAVASVSEESEVEFLYDDPLMNPAPGAGAAGVSETNERARHASSGRPSVAEARAIMQREQLRRTEERVEQLRNRGA